MMLNVTHQRKKTERLPIDWQMQQESIYFQWVYLQKPHTYISANFGVKKGQIWSRSYLFSLDDLRTKNNFLSLYSPKVFQILKNLRIYPNVMGYIHMESS